MNSYGVLREVVLHVLYITFRIEIWQHLFETFDNKIDVSVHGLHHRYLDLSQL